MELPDDATPAQRARFEAGQGGALVPLMRGQDAQELASFDALVAEARQFTAPGHDWAIRFAAAMSGTLKSPPTSADAEAPLQRMVDAMAGRCAWGVILFDRQGHPVRFPLNRAMTRAMTPASVPASAPWHLLQRHGICPASAPRSRGL